MNNKFLSRCIQIAQAMAPTIKELRTSHISFLITKNRIKFIGWNKRKTHPINKKHPYHVGTVGLHAEVDVILKSGLEDFGGLKLLVIRVDKFGKLCNSKPCVGCQSVISQVGIEEVWYSTVQGLVLAE